MNKAQREVAEYLLDKEERIIKQLERQYKQALEDVEMDIRIMLMDEQTPSRIHRVEYQKRLKAQIESTLETLHRNEYKTINQFLQDSYTDSFVGTMYDLHSQGVPVIVPIDQNAAVKAIQLDTQLSDRRIHPNENGEHVTLYESLGVDVDNLKETIRQEITRGLATNMQPEIIARNIANLTKAPLSRAKTIARTESHRIQEASAQDARERAISRGARVLKQWDATMDGATREAHRRLDGQVVEVKESFVYGTLTAMYPGDFGDPAQDCNCRCKAVQRARWMLDEEELEELKRRAEFFGLGEDEAKKQQFSEFEKRFLKSAEAAANPFVIAGELPPHTMDFTNYQDYRKAVEQYNGSMNVHSTYFPNEEWGGFSWDDDERIAQKDCAKRVSATVKQLNDTYPLHSERDDLHIGEFETVQYRLTDIQRSRMDDMAQAQTWTVPDKNMTVMGFNLNGYTGTLADDLQIRSDAISAHKRLDRILDNSPEGVAIHEYGHAMSEWIDQAYVAGDDDAQDYWKWYKSLSKDEIKDGISIYAANNRYEFEAECFAELLTGNPRPLAKKYGEYLEKISGGKISFSMTSSKKAAQTVEKTVKSGIIKTGNAEVRKWYLDSVSRIPDSIDQTLPMVEKARLAFDARNRIRTEAREMMADEATRKLLDQERPNKTFEELITSKMERKGMTREEAIADIYKTATKTNTDVNKELGLED